MCLTPPLLSPARGCVWDSWWLWLHQNSCSWALCVDRLLSWLLSPGTDMAELYLPFLVISGASACHQNFSWKWLPLQKLLQGNNKRSCGWTGIISLESNLEKQSVLLGCLFILFFSVVFISKDENTRHTLTKKKNVFFCFAAKNDPLKKSAIHSRLTWPYCVICGFLTHLPGFQPLLQRNPHGFCSINDSRIRPCGGTCPRVSQVMGTEQDTL